MKNSDIAKKIEGHIRDGETEAALKLLVDYTETEDTDSHDEAVLLSGQFKQWKRENMLGIQQSSSELRRIEATILDILAGRAPVDVPPSFANNAASPAPQPSQAGSTILPIITGVLAVLVVILGVWYFSSDDGKAQGTDGKQTTQQTELTPLGEDKRKEEQPAAVIKNHISAGESLGMEETLYSANQKFFLKVQDDGNAVVYQVQGDSEVPIWATNTNASNVFNAALKMQDDGNLVLERNGKPAWSTQTTGYFYNEKKKEGISVPNFGTKENMPIKMELKNDGNLVLISGTGKVVWESL